MNLSGAHGLLINVTAGMDLRTSEFHVVGDTIKQFASEDATVVVGYVIDPEMTDEIRVTVVATGIGRPMAARGLPPGSAADRAGGGRRARPRARRPLENYADLEIADAHAPPPRGGRRRALATATSRPRHPGVPAPPGGLTRGAAAPAAWRPAVGAGCGLRVGSCSSDPVAGRSCRLTACAGCEVPSQSAA